MSAATNPSPFATLLLSLLPKLFCFARCSLSFWEQSPTTQSEISAYMRLFAEVRSKLGDNLKISVALHPGQYLPSYDLVNYVNLMTYDMRNAPGKSHAEFNDVLSVVKDYIENGGCPKEKIIIGLPLYARNPTDGGVKTYSELVDDSVINTEDIGTKRMVDLVPQNWRSTSKTADGGFYFDSILEAQRKTQWAIESQLAGVFFWELGQDKDEFGVSVVEAVSNIVHEGHRLTRGEMYKGGGEAAGKETLLKTAEDSEIGSRRERRRRKRKMKQQKVANGGEL